MSRNSNFLNSSSTMRSGMAMIMAIGFLVIIAGIMATMLNTTAVTTKRTEHMYFKEQAQLLAKSATEFALLAISAHDRDPVGVVNSSCVQTVTSTFPSVNPYFNIFTRIRYIGLVGASLTCTTNNTNYIPAVNFAPGVIAPESDGTVLIDVYVTSIEGTLNLNQQISYHRRTLQKP
ncbi:MAG: hypothetical protein COA44_10795 [Arcobacter sp.]|nr:MAG: hypothetical protein COA44_10795 [Arcobacter sp.]